MRIKQALAAGLCVLALGALCSVAYGQGGTLDDDEWEVIVAPYVWTVGMSGDVTIEGTEASADVDFEDILDNLDVAGRLRLEVRRGRVGFFVDPTYVNLSTDGNVGPVGVGIDTECMFVEFGGYYRVGIGPIEEFEVEVATVDLLVGGRYWDIESKIDFPASPDAQGGEEWIDPIVGVRFVAADPMAGLSILVEGDIGGFGAGSDLTWNVTTLLGWRFMERATVWLGYRVLDVDYDEGSGASRFEFDAVMSGPLAGCALRF